MVGSVENAALKFPRMAALARRLLRRQKFESIAASDSAASIPHAAVRQRRRWHVKDARLAARTTTVSRDTGVRARGRTYIVGRMSLIAAQAALIAGVLVQWTRRRQAEDGRLKSETARRASNAPVSYLAGR